MKVVWRLERTASVEPWGWGSEGLLTFVIGGNSNAFPFNFLCYRYWTNKNRKRPNLKSFLFFGKKMVSAELKLQSSSHMAGLRPCSKSQIILGSPAMKEPTKKLSRERSRINRKSP
ncbi:hypothetical protein TNCV_4429541 [Trichonephila clavipes]|nr:hypothetical protein TNCV_4429541 [Trichonephila clavipes]